MNENDGSDKLDENKKSSTDEEEEEISISEYISVNVKSQTSGSYEETPKFIDSNKKQRLFEIDDAVEECVASPSSNKFEIDDLQLSGDNIAQHFQPLSDYEEDEVEREEMNVNSVNMTREFVSKNKLLQMSNDVDSLDQILNETEPPKEAAINLNSRNYNDKELSPLQEDDILINDSKISIHSLNKLHKQSNLCVSPDTSLNTTNDISDLAKDTLTESDLNVMNNESEVLSKSSTEKEDESCEETPKSSSKLGSGNLEKISLHEEEQQINSREDFALNNSNKGAHTGTPLDMESEVLPQIEAEHPDVPSVKSMETVAEFKEALENITEESESEKTLENSKRSSDKSETLKHMTIEKGKEMRKILEEKILNRVPLDSNEGDENKENIAAPNSINGDVISLNMFQTMDTKVKELQEIIASKDVCLAALNMKIDNFSRCGSLREGHDSFKETLRNSADTNSIATNSTEYITLQDDFMPAKMMDIQGEIVARDQLIEELTESLQNSMDVRKQLQSQGEKLTIEISELRKQLAMTAETIKKPHWMRDHESTGQRISEISIDLVSETDEAESERNFSETHNDSSNRISREQQEDLDDLDTYDTRLLMMPFTLSTQLTEFQKFLTQDESRLFNMVHNKFDEFMKQEVDKMQQLHENETKSLREKIELEKIDRDGEVNRLRQMLSSIKCGSTEIMELRDELEAKHTQEMADLRTYFEKKCAELEKQYSEEVFSQQSRRLSNDTSSELSDQEDFPEENGGYHSKHGSPKAKRNKEVIYLSPTHRKITPTNIESKSLESEKKLENDPEPTLVELKQFYQDKIMEINQNHEETCRKLQEKLMKFEEKQADEKFLSQDNKKGSDYLTQSPSEPNRLTNIHNEHNDLQEIIAEYERRLQEQVAFAREDVLRELEIQIQALLSDTAAEDSHWPPELILLREKFTAKSQLEIAQLQIKHEEEMSRMNSDFEKQLRRKLKRQNTFDSSRDLDKIISERDSLRELSSTLRCVLIELAKFFSNCEDDLNNTVIDELQRHGILSNNTDILDTTNQDFNVSQVTAFSPTKKYLKFTPDVSGIISIIEDPLLLDFISKTRENNDNDNLLNLDDCLERLRFEALNILELSERLCKKGSILQEEVQPIKETEKEDSCEEEDGLKRGIIKNKDKHLTRSFDENSLRGEIKNNTIINSPSSLPNNLGATLTNGELNVQLHELRNCLLKSEEERRSLVSELECALSKRDSLVVELCETKQHLIGLGKQREVFSEGYGTNTTTLQECTMKNLSSFLDVQEKAKHLLSTPNETNMKNNAILLQLVEDFCRESERYVEDGKRDKHDLQSQIKIPTIVSSSCRKIEAADKQLKATRQFLEDQAAEREQERDDFTKEIEKLKTQLREKDKDKLNFERISKEQGYVCEKCCSRSNKDIVENIEVMEQQHKEMTSQLIRSDEQKYKLEQDLKDSIDKVFTLREVITELETQIENKTICEHEMEAKFKKQELYIEAQICQNESLRKEIGHFKLETDSRAYDEKISNLEEKLRRNSGSAEQSTVLEQITRQLRKIGQTLDQKTKTLVALHATSYSTLSCSSPSEDISVQDSNHFEKKKSLSPSKENASFLSIEEVDRIFDKLDTHSKVEDMAIKRVNDLEMQINGIRGSYLELQHERDALHERLTEQSFKISSLQSKLDEQRLRAEELHNERTSHLTIKLHDLQNELVNLKETLQARDKQVTNLKKFLENSKQVIDRQETELAMGQNGNDRSQFEVKLETDLKQKCEEIVALKMKIKNEMINKIALPDLMETMLSDKNEEIDQLKDKLQQLQPSNKQQLLLKEDDNARTLSDIVSISEFDESDMIRKIHDQNEGYLFTPNSLPMETTPIQNNLREGSSRNHLDESPLFEPRQSSSLGPLAKPNYFQDFSTHPKDCGSIFMQEMPIRQINFSMIESSNSYGRLAQENYIKTPAFIEEIREDDKKQKSITLTDLNAEEDKMKLQNELESLKRGLDKITTENNEKLEKINAEMKDKESVISDIKFELAARNKLYADLMHEKKILQGELHEIRLNLTKFELIETDLEKKEAEMKEVVLNFNQKEEELRETVFLMNRLQDEHRACVKDNNLLKSRVNDTKQEAQIDTLKQQIESLNKTIDHKDELLVKMEKDLLNYTKSEQKYLEDIKVLESKDCDMKLLQGKLKDKEHEIELLNEDNRFLNDDINRLKDDIVKTSSANSNNSVVQFMKQNCAKLDEELQESKYLLTEKMLSLERVKLDVVSYEKELEILRIQLKEKESFIQQMGDDGNSLHAALSSIQNKMQENNKKLKEEQEKNQSLQGEIDRLMALLNRSENSSSPKPFSVEEIEKVIEKELNYSAQLDSNIWRAIESDEINSDEDERAGKKSKPSKIEDLRSKLKTEIDINANLQSKLETEKRNSNAIQMQDADMIEKMRLRLESAIDNETILQKMLEDERNKNEKLSTLVSGVQRTKSFDNYILMKTKSPMESPRRLHRSNELEFEIYNRLESEIKLLTSQNEREKERVMDLQRSLDRERNRIDKEISDRNDYGEKMKRELNRSFKEKESIELDLDHAQEKLELAQQEIKSLEKRISILVEADKRRASIRDQNSQNTSKLQELILKQHHEEHERNQLQETINILRADIERGAQREARMAATLSKENYSLENGVGTTVPEEFFVKLNEMNHLLESNTRENHQLAETLHLLTEERRALQQRVTELEDLNIHNNHHTNRDDLEVRANHLFGKYLRLESHRKALIHQKRYLLIVLATYEDSEDKTLNLLRSTRPLISSQPKTHKSFKAAALVIIAIERMKYIVKRWQSSKRIGASAIFSHQFSIPRRSQSASTNLWTQSSNSHFVEYSSPPSRDNNAHYVRPLGARSLFGSNLLEKLEEQIDQVTHNNST